MVATNRMTSGLLEQVQQRLGHKPDAMTLRRRTVEHVSIEMSLHVLAYNLKRLISMLGIAGTMKAIKSARA